jgi:TrmH RNA methyltransferase
MQKQEIKIQGIHACKAIWHNRRSAIIRAYIAEERAADFGELLHWCAEQRKAYHLVSSEELDKICASTHHEGICILAHQKPMLSLESFVALARSDMARPLCAILLDKIQNPHNIGAIARSSAFFGVDALLLASDKNKAIPLPPSAYRAAQGGLEHFELIEVSDPKQALDMLHEVGFASIATSSKVQNSLFAQDLPPRCLFVLGEEAHGLSPNLMRAATHKVAILGSGHIESLNVSNAAAICISEYRRYHPYKSTTPKSIAKSK